MRPKHTRLKLVKDVSVAAAHATYKTLPPLPRWDEVTAWLHQLNAKSGGGDVWLYCQDAGFPDARWTVGDHVLDPSGRWPGADHSEHLPGNGQRFDAAAAARRLMSEARSAGFR